MHSTKTMRVTQRIIIYLVLKHVGTAPNWQAICRIRVQISGHIFFLFSLHPLHVFHLQSLLSTNVKGVQGYLHSARQLSQANSSRFSAANVAALRHIYWETAACDFAHVVTVMCCTSEAE